MDVIFHSAVIFVRDMAEARRFYCDALGMAVDMDMGANVVLAGGVTLWQVREGHIIPRTVGPDGIGNRDHGGELYFETGDVDGVRTALSGRGVRFLHDVHEEPWGQRTVRVFDPDGAIVEIGETPAAFLGRMRDGGMSIDDIAAKTGMTAHDIIRSIG